MSEEPEKKKRRTTKKRPAAAAEVGNADPRAPVDGAALLSALAPLERRLEEDLLARARGSAAVLRGLEERWQREKAAHRTADPFDVWQRAFVEQVAAAWLLSCVFVRTLEDRGLLAQNRLAGPGATDSQKAFFDLAPSLSERDYLLLTFRELAHLPAAKDLFDPQHNPVWMLGPSAETARALLDFFRTPSAEAPAFRFGGSDTRFLGDLYQDLSEDVRKRYALLQTPRFVEEYILDRTLDRAIARFGLNETTLIDPTCGSGHFLLGAFARLVDAFLRAEPGLDPRQAAQKALDRVAGSDINPYAVAIARFRLVLAFVEAGKYARLADAPAPKLHLAVADSLLHGKDGGAQKTLADIGGVTAEEIWGHVYALEDPTAARDVLDKRYAAVVGNPPYITVKDAAVREEIRKSYPKSAAGKYSLAAPFAERFFQLARSGGAVGMITANSFMKREFGKKLIEEVLPHLNLDGIVNTSGAYIPGHGTPTVLLFGTNEGPIDKTVLSVLAKRGEPSTPDDPEQGLVWRSVVDHGNEVGFDNDYISVARVERETLDKHPWSLGGGGAAELKELLEERAAKRLGEIADSIGIASFTLEDDVFLRPRDTWSRIGVPDAATRPMVIGEAIRDWSIGDVPVAMFPYDQATLEPLAPTGASARAMWPWRTSIANNILFGGRTKVESGVAWFEYGRLTADKLRTPLTITFAFVATHNHFVLDRGGKVFKQSAPIIKLPPDATEDDHLALLAYLNSSTACFWMKQVFYPKATSTGDISTEKGKPEANRYEFAGTGLGPLPLPPVDSAVRARTIALARRALELAGAREHAIGSWLDAPTESLDRVLSRRDEQLAELKRIQNEIDEIIYAAFGLARDTDVALIETPNYKRLWLGRRGVFGHGAMSDREEVDAQVNERLLDLIELASRATATPTSSVALRTHASSAPTVQPLHAALALDGTASDWLAKVDVEREAVPFLAAYRYTDAGMEKRTAWEQTWELQRREDAGEKIADIPVPPKYGQSDYREASYWRLRGKLDVPKERFISYPGCESDEDKQPVYGWAGWDHKQRAMALMTLYQDRKTREGWPADRLAPILAGLRELLPWLKQWHADVDPEFGMSMSDYFHNLYEAERAHLGVTDQQLADWRPAAKGRGRRKASA